MPRKKEAEPITKVTLNLYSDSWKRLQELYPGIGASKAARQIIRAHVMQVDKKIATESEVTVPEIDVEIEGV